MNIDDLDENVFEPKALWRRQNSERLACRARRKHARATKKALHKATHKAKGNHAQKSRVAKAGTGSKAVRAKTVWHVDLPDWFRSTVDGFGDLSTLLEEREIESLESSGTLNACFPADAAVPWLAPDSPPPESVYSSEEHISSDLTSHVPSAADVCQAPRLSKEIAEAAVQCTPEEMIEPMAPSALGQRMCLNKLRTATLYPTVAYSVETHFSLFEDAYKIAAFTDNLNACELKALANRFLGKEIAGVAVHRGSRSPRRVPERYVAEAALIGDFEGTFRENLLMSAKRLLLGSFAGSPFHGQGLIQLAHENPTDWAKSTFTAMDFAGRLIRAGALPKAFAAELLAGLAELPASTESGKMLVLALLIVLPALRRSLPGHARSLQFARVFSRQTSSTFSRQTSLCRSVTAPPILMHCSRSVGIGLHLQDDFQPYSFVSVNKANKTGAPADVGPPIDPVFLPDYWRYAAGGEHSSEELERRACGADEVLTQLASD